MVEVELGDELLNQVEVTNGPLPENTISSKVKFDAKGTLHMMCRDSDGKLLKDVPIKNANITENFNDGLIKDYKHEHEVLKSSNLKLNILFGLIIILLLLPTAFILITLIMR